MSLSSTLQPHLIQHTESGNRYLPLVGGTCWTFGRSEDNNFVLLDRWISRHHAMLQYMESGEFYLIDLGSRNGSFLNGRRVSIPVTLRNGDLVTFGQTELEFYCPATSQPPLSVVEPEAKDFTSTAILQVRRMISVLVIDIRDFTGLTRQLDEKILAELIGSWFRCSGAIIREYGSWVDKYIGDAVMAVWIHDEDNVSNNDMWRILQAIDALYLMTTDLSDKYPLPFPLRIGAGLNTGYAMVGNTGSSDRPDYTALGDTVNAAFRLESATKQIGSNIAIGRTTYSYILKLDGDLGLFQEHNIELKGYDEPMIAYACTFKDLDLFLSQFRSL